MTVSGCFLVAIWCLGGKYAVWGGIWQGWVVFWGGLGVSTDPTSSH